MRKDLNETIKNEQRAPLPNSMDTDVSTSRIAQMDRNHKGAVYIVHREEEEESE